MNFEDYYKQKYREIESKINDVILTEKDENIKMLTSYALGGKYFRGVLTCLVSDLLGGDNEKALKYAVIIEFLQTSSLLHDDIIDMDLLRRGKPSLWTVASDLIERKDIKSTITNFISSLENRVISVLRLLMKRHTIPIAILTGDTLLIKAIQIADNDIRDEIVKVVHDMLSGVCYEVEKYKNREIFYKCINGKTASLFRFSTWLGWKAAGKPEKYNFVPIIGEKLGVLYQLTDEMVDDELPSFIDPKLEIRKVYNEVMTLIDKLPDNEYKEMFKEVPLYMIRKLAAESNKEDEILKIVER